jgi:hypothetical protein
LKKNFILIYLGLALFAFSCKKELTSVGKDGLSSDLYLNSDAIDTFQLESYTVEEDTLLSSNLSIAMLGSYKDPVFGTFTSEFFTQFRLPGFNPDFGDLSTIVIDSFVLGLEYRGYYGSLEPQKFEVYELNEDLYKDSVYYSFQTKSVKTQNLVLPNHAVLKPDPINQTVIGTEKVESQLRLHLDTSFARNLMLESQINPDFFSSNEKFLTYFKGLNVRVNNSSQNEKEGAILYFNLEDPLSKLTIYYKIDGLVKSFDFLINSECADFNHHSIDNSGKNVFNVINNPVLGNETFYAQANKSRAVVKVSHLTKIPKNALIQYAKLVLPVNYYSLEPYFPSTLITVATKINLNDNNLYNLKVLGEYNDLTKSYTIDLRDYAQQVVNGKIDNLGVYLSSSRMLSSSERIVFNGAQTTNKNKPKLYIVYTNY